MFNSVADEGDSGNPVEEWRDEEEILQESQGAQSFGVTS